MVPLSYNARSLLVRRSATFLTVISIAATVAVVCGVLALQQGFQTLFSQSGRDGIVVCLRPGASSENESIFPMDRSEILIKSAPEIAEGPDGQPLAAAEIYLAVRRNKVDGGETNVPIRGVQPKSFELAGDMLEIVEGRNFEPGTDEVIVGKAMQGRIQDCELDSEIILNLVPFKVVGIFEYDGTFRSEIWGDAARIQVVLERPGFNRVIAKLRDDVTVEQFAERIADDDQVPAKVVSETEYLTGQTRMLSAGLNILGIFLGVIMGIAAIFTGTNTMLSAVSARSHEIGILLSVGFRPIAIFFSFLLEALLLGLLGGLVGCLLVLPINGIKTGTTNWETFTEIAFAFRVTPQVLVVAVIFSIILGVLGGAWPAWRAARLKPTVALRRV